MGGEQGQLAPTEGELFEKLAAIHRKTVELKVTPLVALVDLGDGVQVEVRQPKLATRRRIYDRATKIVETGGLKSATVDNHVVEVEAVIECCFVPGTDRKVFGDAHRKLFDDHVPGGWFDKLALQAVEFMTGGAKQMGKTSGATPSASSSGSSPNGSAGEPLTSGPSD